MIPADEALRRLREGNARFVRGESTSDPQRLVQARDRTRDGQKPFAIIFGCSDSRVPAEHVFDQGLGDLFVIRVAGNVVAPSQIGSVEFAADQFETRLVVVLGHSRCGAVLATLEQLRKPQDLRSPNLRAIVERISPAVEPLVTEADEVDARALEQAAVRANVRSAAEALRHGSAMLEQFIDSEGLKIVCAEYSLETGEVEYFE